MKSHLTFTKIVSTPTDTDWSQSYNAGNLAAVINLTRSPLENAVADEELMISLSALGKDILNTFEAEYFTLETKSLLTIKQALTTTAEKIPEDVSLSFVLAVILQNVLYVFIYGKGSIYLKRKEKLGLLLHGTEEKKLVAASGYMQHEDIVVLETAPFTHIVTQEMLTNSLAHFDESSEILSPLVHQHQNGGASAIAFTYYDAESSQQPEEIEETEETEMNDYEKETPAMEEVADEEKAEKKEVRHLHINLFPFLSHKRKLMLTIAVIIIMVLIGSIFLAIKKQQSQSEANLYQSLIVPAQNKFNEGKSLLDLNRNLAEQDFTTAHAMIIQAQGKFPANSESGKQAQLLLSQINDALTSVQTANNTSVKQIDITTIPFLNIASKQTYMGITEDDTNVYTMTAAGVQKISKTSNQATKQIIKNSTDWKNGTAIGTYLGNFYVLDTTGGVLKYISTGGGFTKANYFATNVSPDLSKATSLTIDGSIWILTSDGTILKFTKGQQDTFTLKGLDKPLSSPTRITTSADMTNVYLLDNGNQRLVVIDKNGTYIASYQNAIIAKAKELEVDEKNKKVYLLSDTQAYEVDLK